MESGDVIVYEHPNGKDYVGYIAEGWWQWPAAEGGWQERKAGKESDVDTSRELEPKNAALALRLSGVTE